MKKILNFALCVVCSIASLTGCSKPLNPSGGEEPDYSGFPNMVDVDTAKYAFEFEQMTTPYFKGNVIYNETVMLVKSKKDGVISGKLQYKPLKILSVRDYTWKNEFSADKYTVEGNVITVKEDSGIPFLSEDNLKGIDVPAPYRQVNSISNVETDFVLMGATIYSESSLIYGHQISVSYVYDVKDLKLEDFADYESSGLIKTKEKLNKGEDVKIVITGDSVAEGCSSSKHFNHEPFMDNWATQTVRALDGKYNGKVTASNIAVGGKTSDWGATNAHIDSIAKNNPDLVIIHFGVNDAGNKNTPTTYSSNIETIIEDARLTDCEFLLIKAFTTEPNSYDLTLIERYWSKIDSICEQHDNVYSIDMYSLSKTMLAEKKYMDVTGNGINHLNDYSSRLYTMNLLSALVKY